MIQYIHKEREIQKEAEMFEIQGCIKIEATIKHNWQVREFFEWCEESHEIWFLDKEQQKVGQVGFADSLEDAKEAIANHLEQTRRAYKVVAIAECV